MKPAQRIRKAVVPAAGLGTRLLPVTKSVPKELLPLGNKPLIQYVVEEAVASGIESIVLVTSPTKGVLEDHFKSSPDLESYLEEKGKRAEANLVRHVSRFAEVRVVRQEKPLGLGHSIGCARTLVGDEPFAVLLPDLIINSQTPCLRQLVDAYASHPGCMVATLKVDADTVERCGILAVDPLPVPGTKERLLRVIDLVEKPHPDRAPSRLAIVGRYLLDPEVFQCIDRTPPDNHGEIQITDSIRLYSRMKPVYALRFEGTLYDVGDPLGLLRATVELGLKDPDYGQAFRAYLSSLRFVP